VNRRAGNALRWLPALTAAAYVTTVAVMSPGLIDDLYWDSDASSWFVLAERLRGDGPVYIPHFPSWTSLWWLLATRDVPGHEELWQAMGYPFAVAGAALLGWATVRVAGRWAGVTAGATALIVGPLAVRSQLTITYHVVPPFTAAVLCAYLVALARNRSWVLAVAVGVLCGLNAASDPLVWLVAIAPFAIAAAVLTSAIKRRDLALRAGVALGTAIVSALAAYGLMRSLGFHLVDIGFRLADPGDLASNVRHLGRMVALLGGANYALPGGYPREPLRILLALLVLVAVAATVYSGIRHIARRSEPVTLAFACYWATSTVLLGVVFVATTNAAALGAGSVNYLLTLAPAAGAGVALLAAGSRRAQLVVALAVAGVGAVNMAGIAEGHAGTPKDAIGTYERPVVRLLTREGVTRGYAGYWDAANLTWQSGRRVIVSPVSLCDGPRGPSLCASTFFTIRSWYDERPGRSFLIVDRSTAFVNEPPAVVQNASASYRFGTLTVYLFAYNLARQIRRPAP